MVTNITRENRDPYNSVLPLPLAPLAGSETVFEPDVPVRPVFGNAVVDGLHYIVRCDRRADGFLFAQDPHQLFHCREAALLILLDGLNDTNNLVLVFLVLPVHPDNKIFHCFPC